ncbi:hypothetical protein ACIG56_15970 [Nocardia fusca]|uniref:hypothetical protein n=1 Tax=Nocardia fusca TaxID=941183 RepID=UPI0037C68B27
MVEIEPTATPARAAISSTVTSSAACSANTSSAARSKASTVRCFRGSMARSCNRCKIFAAAIDLDIAEIMARPGAL